MRSILLFLGFLTGASIAVSAQEYREGRRVTTPGRDTAAAVPLFGTIRGRVVDESTGEGLAGAQVLLEGTTQGAIADEDGNFKIFKVPVGTYKLKADFLGFRPLELDNVRVEVGLEAVVQAQLVSEDIQIEAVSVQGVRRRGSSVSVVSEIRAAEQVVTGISSDQIARSQDRDLSQVVRRLPGISIRENRFIIIRGLSERYNITLINNALPPSAESEVKAFAFDLIPGSVIDRLLVYKSGAPELPAEFAGGTIKIFTRLPVENELSVSYSAGLRLGTTFNDFYRYEGGKFDFLGFDDGTRALPDDFPEDISELGLNNPAALEDASKKLPNNWETLKGTAIPDQRLNLSLSRVVNRDRFRFGNVSSLSYSYANLQQQVERNQLNINQTAQNDLIFNYVDEQYDNTVRVGLLHNWFFVLNNGRDRLEFKNMLNQLGTSQTTLRTGENYEAGSEQQSVAFRYESRLLYSGQITGDHRLGRRQRTVLDWNAGYGYANRQEPDFRRAVARRAIGSPDTVAFQVTIPPSAARDEAGRFYANAIEHLATGSINLVHRFRDADSTERVPYVRAGVFGEYKYRDYAARWMSYSWGSSPNADIQAQPLEEIFGPDNIDAQSGLVLREGTNPEDRYLADNTVLSGYVGAGLPFGRFMLSGGVRLETSQQTLESELDGAPLSVSLDLIAPLPSANLAFYLNEKMLLRAAYFASIDRPEFRELAPFQYYDFRYNYVLRGNPDLEIPRIHNIDFRYEWYPREGETILVGGFYKTFKDAIETYFEPGAGSLGSNNFSFGNAPSSYSLGAEIEVRKSLEGLSTSGFLEDLSFVFNASYIVSEVDLGDNAQQQDQNRPMMGQSAYTVNAGIYYDNEPLGLQVTALYNVIGPRLFAVGINGQPDIYEMPRHQIDLNIEKRLRPWLFLQVSAQDLLNNYYRLLQDSDFDDKLEINSDIFMQRNRPGSYFLVGLRAKF